jgi:hypothetical protein
LWDSNNRLGLGIGCCVVGGIGLLWLGWRHWDDGAWLVGNIFVPGWSSGLAGLISTFVNLYGSDDSVHYGATTIATLTVTGGFIVICGYVAGIYTVVKVLTILRAKRYHVMRERSEDGAV